MDICLPVELLPAVLVLMIVVGQLFRPFHFRNIIFTIIIAELGYLHFLHMYIMYTRKFISSSGLFLTSQPVFITIGVFIYIYIRSIQNEITSFSQVDIRHFVPGIISIVMLIVCMVLPEEISLCMRSSMAGNAAVMIFFFCAWFLLAVYITKSILIVRNSLVKGNPVHRVFRKLMALLFLVFPAMISGILTVLLRLPDTACISRLYIVIISVILVSLYILMQRNPYLVQYGTIPLRKKQGDNKFPAGTDIDNLKNMLRIIMEEEKLFCDEDLSLGRLSSVLGITPHQLSRLLNEHFGKNFNSYINMYRIREAQTLLLEEPERNTHSIAHAVGFNSYSVFYTSFRKETTISPAEFRKKSGNS